MPRDKKPKTEKPTRAGDTRRQGKKSVNWKEDPEILERLVKVAQLMNKNKRAFEIASATAVSIPTAVLDISRVRELWREDAKERISNARGIAIAQYGAIIDQAWEDVKKVGVSNPVRAAYLNVIIKAQRQVDSVSGIAERHELTGPNGGPIQHEVKDIEKVRKKRWAQVAPSLAAMQAKESNDEPTTEQKSE